MASRTRSARSRSVRPIIELPRRYGGGCQGDEADMIVTSTDIKGLQEARTGKVRDVYDLGDSLLIVATDRLSAFDVVLPTGIPDKGKVLTQISLFWFDMTQGNGREPRHHSRHRRDSGPHRHSRGRRIRRSIGRCWTVGRWSSSRLTPYPIECVVRGYLAGSAWKEYSALRKAAGNGGGIVLHGVELPSDMVESQKLPRAGIHAVHQGIRGARHQHQRAAGAGDRG